MKITQVELEQEKNRQKKMVCWLSGWEGEFRLKKGLVINLDHDNREVDWVISKIYSTQQHNKIRRAWDVGGL